MIKKYFLIGFLIVVLGLTGFSQIAPRFKIEDFVWVRVSTDRTAIYVGDRFELKLEIFYPKDWGIEILTEDLEKSSMAAMLPSSVRVEKAKISQPISWNKYWLKIETVYTLFYPEKRHKIGILFSPPKSETTEPIKVRFKWLNPEEKEPKKNIGVYEIDIKPFVIGVRTTLTDTSYKPRDLKRYFGKFGQKSFGGLVVGFLFVLLGLSIPVRELILFIKKRGQREKELSLKQLLENQYGKLNILREISDLKEFSDSFCLFLRELIAIKTGLKTKSLIALEIKEAMTEEDEADGAVNKLLGLLEEHDNFRYNSRAKPVSKERSLKTTEEVLSQWLIQSGQQRKRWFLKKWFFGN